VRRLHLPARTELRRGLELPSVSCYLAKAPFKAPSERALPSGHRQRGAGHFVHMARVEIQDLGKFYQGANGAPLWVLRQVSLSVAEGEFLVLVGPSGAGKTTLLRLLAGLETPSTGTIRIDGRDMAHMGPAERDLAMVFQNHALYPHLTAGENLALGLILRKIPRAEIERTVRETAALLGLESCLDRRPSALSGGERQRVALGRALARKPRVLLLDEPFSNLDAPRRAELRQELARLHQRLGMTLLCATHDQADALALGDHLAVLKEGLLQQVGENQALYQAPANLFVATFLGAPRMNLVRGTLAAQADTLWFKSESRTTSPGEGLAFPLPPDQAGKLKGNVGPMLLCGLRPEHLQCLNSSDDGKPDGQALLERIELAGADHYLYLRLAAASAQTLVARVSSETLFRVRETLHVRIQPRHARFFDPVTGQCIG
jgi:multiple sugar transport system ATP-binding protein